MEITNMKKDKKLNVKIIATNDLDSVIKRAEQGDFLHDDEVIVGDSKAIKRLMEILAGLDDEGNPI
jgi:hypothetical protein